MSIQPPFLANQYNLQFVQEREDQLEFQNTLQTRNEYNV